MVTREDIVGEVRSWIGTPVRHQGRVKGVSTDCLGLAIGVPAALDMPEAESVGAGIRNYDWGFRGRVLYDGLCGALVRTDEARPGDLLAILMGRDPFPRHLAFVTRPDWIVHAYGKGVKRVAEVPIGPLRVHSVWTWPSLGGSDG